MSTNMNQEKILNAVSYKQLSFEYKSLLEEVGNQNAAKLALLMAFWLKLLRTGLSFGFNFDHECLNLIEMMSLRDGIKIRRKPKTQKGWVAKLKVFAWNVLSMIPVSKGIIPGGVMTKKDRFLAVLTSYKIKKYTFKIDFQLKEKFINIAHSLLDAKSSAALESALPNIFFFKENKKPSLFPGNIQGAPIAFLDGFHTKVLYIGKPIKILGIQHGGGYGELKKFLVEEFEASIADRFFHWGLGKNNVRQTRYPVLSPSDVTLSSIRVLGTTELNDIYSAIIGIEKSKYQELLDRRIEYFSKLKPECHFGFIQAPKNKTQEDYKDVSSCYLSDLSHSEKTSSLFILDWPYHTFFFQAVYQAYPFIMFFKREWKKYFTSKYIELLDFLEKQSILFYWDQQYDFFERVKYLSENYTYPSLIFLKVRRFLEQK
jgi:hypothetical protein